MSKNRLIAVLILLGLAMVAGYFVSQKTALRESSQLLPQTASADYEKKLADCKAIPNTSQVRIAGTSRLFINLPKDIYPDKEHNLQFTVIQGEASAGWISNAGPYGEAFEATPDCWSYYYEFNGSEGAEIDLRVKSAVQGAPDYFIQFFIVPSAA